MSVLETTAQLKTYVLEGMGEIVDGTSEFDAKVERQLVRCSRALHAGGLELAPEIKSPVLFPWAKSQYPVIVNFETPLSAGTVEATEGSTTVTFSSAPVASVAGWYVMIGDDPEIYRIATHAAGVATATLDAPFVGTSVTTGAYDAFRLRYDFGTDILAPISPIRVFWNAAGRMQEIQIVDETAFDRDWPISDVRQDYPEEAKVVYQTSGTLSLQFNAYPAGTERMEMDYIAMPPELNATTPVNPVMPVHHRVVIAEWALYYMLQEVDDDRANAHLPIAKNGLSAMVNEARGIQRAANRNVGRVIPRPEQMAQSRKILRTQDGFIIG